MPLFIFLCAEPFDGYLNSQNMQLLKPVKIYCSFATRVSQLKICDFSEAFKGFEGL